MTVQIVDRASGQILHVGRAGRVSERIKNTYLAKGIKLIITTYWMHTVVKVESL